MSETETAEKPAKDNLNGVTRPAAGTKTRRVWDIADEISASTGAPALRGDVMKQGEDEGLSKGTIATQYGRWCTYHSVDREQREAARAAAKGQPEAQTTDGAE